MNFAILKVSGGHLNARVYNNSCFSETVKQCGANDDTFRFANSVKGTPSYQQKLKSEVLVMVKQFGIPTFFLLLSYANTRWN